MKLKVSRNFLITIAWFIFSFFLVFLYQKSCAINDIIYSNVTITLINFACLILCSFLLNQYLIPKYLYKKKIKRFVVLLFILILFIANAIRWLQWSWYVLSGILDKERAFKLINDFYFQLFDIYMLVLFGCVCIIAYRLIIDQWNFQTRFVQLQKENAQTELSFLKAQINPHFLFNSINSIFAHIDKSNVEAREIVLKFSDMLRYQLYECNTELINFEKEFAYLNNYVALQRLRKEENLVINIETIGKMTGFEIAPLLLVPFIENAFKYASNHDEKQNFLKIILTKAPTYFNFYCINTRDRIVSRDVVEDSGIGINNVKRRLELIYPEKHELTVNEDDIKFEVNLKIILA